MSATCSSINGCLKQERILLPLHCQHGQNLWLVTKYIPWKSNFVPCRYVLEVDFVLVLVFYILCKATATACTSPGKSHSYMSRPYPSLTYYFISLMHYTVGWGLVKVSWKMLYEWLSTSWTHKDQHFKAMILFTTHTCTNPSSYCLQQQPHNWP